MSDPSKTGTENFLGETDASHVRRERFCQEYSVHLNGARAARDAGYSAETAAGIACELLKDPRIQIRVRELLDEAAKNYGITPGLIINELKKVALVNMEDYSALTSDGERYITLAQATRDQLAAVSELQVEDFVDGRGDFKRDIKKTKIKLNDKIRALDLLAKILGMQIEKKEITGKDGAPLSNTLVVEFTDPDDESKAS